MISAHPPNLPDTLRFVDGKLEVLDQRLLPREERYWRLETLADAWTAINTLAVRGAPAIGVAAGYALAQSMHPDLSGDEYTARLHANADHLREARPTAVNLAWAVDRLVESARQARDKHDCHRLLLDEAEAIHAEDEANCAKIGEHGAPLIEPGANVLTHCNAGSLAVSRLGTATAPMYTQHTAGLPFHVYVDETRPLYQGARLTAWELNRCGIDVTLICDNAAATIMAAGDIDLAIVGTDRVAANGDVVNKIGTLNVAILCAHFSIPFYVACPSSTFDPATPTGAHVRIEQRAQEEVLGDHAAPVAAANPAFDVTPHELVTGVITEHGIAYSPAALREMLTN